MTEAQFMGIIFHRTLCEHVLSESFGCPTGRRTQWSWGRACGPASTVLVIGLFQTGLQMYCLWVDSSVVPKAAGSGPLSSPCTYCIGSIPTFTYSKSLWRSAWTISVVTSSKLFLISYILSQISLKKSSFICVFEPQNESVLKRLQQKSHLLVPIFTTFWKIRKQAWSDWWCVSFKHHSWDYAWYFIPATPGDINKDTTDPVTNKQFYLKLVSISTFQTIFTDGLKSADGHGVVTAAVIS